MSIILHCNAVHSELPIYLGSCFRSSLTECYHDFFATQSNFCVSFIRVCKFWCLKVFLNNVQFGLLRYVEALAVSIGSYFLLITSIDGPLLLNFNIASAGVRMFSILGLFALRTIFYKISWSWFIRCKGKFMFHRSLSTFKLLDGSTIFHFVSLK